MLHPKQVEAFRRMTPLEKLELLERIIHMARALKAAGLRRAHPDWSEEQVQVAVRESFLYART